MFTALAAVVVLIISSFIVSNVVGSPENSALSAATPSTSGIDIIYPAKKASWEIGMYKTIQWKDRSGYTGKYHIFVRAHPSQPRPFVVKLDVQVQQHNWLAGLFQYFTGPVYILPAGIYELEICRAITQGSSCARREIALSGTSKPVITAVSSRPYEQGSPLTRGRVGSTVRIFGINFTSTNNTIRFGENGVIRNVDSPGDGAAILFTLPAQMENYNCRSESSGCKPTINIGPATYQVRVINENGASLPSPFTVIP